MDHHVPPTARELLVTTGWGLLSVALTLFLAWVAVQVLPHEEPKQHERDRTHIPFCSATRGCFA